VVGLLASAVSAPATAGVHLRHRSRAWIAAQEHRRRPLSSDRPEPFSHGSWFPHV